MMVEGYWLAFIPLCFVLGWLMGSIREVRAHTQSLTDHLDFMRSVWPESFEEDAGEEENGR